MTTDPDLGTEEKRYMQIGEVAERTGLTQRTLRFYEEKGLLKPPTRMEGGFRLYSEEDLQRIELIKKLKGLLGFSLAEIREMVEAEEVRTQLRTHYRHLADMRLRIQGLRRAIEASAYQLRLIDQKIQQLEELRQSLRDKIAHYREVMARLEGELTERPAEVPSLSGVGSSSGPSTREGG